VTFLDLLLEKPLGATFHLFQIWDPVALGLGETEWLFYLGPLDLAIRISYLVLVVIRVMR
jgi:hypothetical protein